MYTIMLSEDYYVTIILSKGESHLNISPRDSLFNERPLPLYNKASQGDMSCERFTLHVEYLFLKFMAGILVNSTKLLLE